MRSYDAIVVGGGHNGLTCAAYMAKAGAKVCVLEQRAFVGGASVTREVFPGHKVSVAAYWMSMLQPKIMRDLELRRRGVEPIPTPPTLHPFADGRSVVFWPDRARVQDELAQFSQKDAEAYAAYDDHMTRIVAALRPMLFETPVDPTDLSLRGLRRTLKLAWRNRRALPHFYDLWDLLTLSAWDYLHRWFESDEIRTIFASYASGSAGILSPKSPGSAYVLARPYLRDNSTDQGPGGLIRGGMGAITQALREAAEAYGATVLTGKTVRRVIIEKGTVQGVELEDGSRIDAPVVVSNAGARATYRDLLGKDHVAPEILGQIDRHRTRSIAFKINLSTRALPRWTAFDERQLNVAGPGGITLAENSDELEDAFQSAMNGEMAPRPYLWITTPSAFDDSVAPEGRHVVQIMGGHVPYALNGREWDADTRQELVDIVLSQICRYAPGFDQDVLDAQVLTPKDIESMFSMIDGHVHHGEMSLDQIFFRRPIAHYADYRTPVKGVYMCGAACHPGGGVNGVPGHNAAREVLADMGRKFPAQPY
ncbi:phytoene desaturase family protein [Ponticoccus sp. (in: a-proteobacteria)]|uniref:phytoene desaturase family protein n=1 Tax=Ponticoccus sp. (in: a-proteobacteria) TaxID=1925025 RepID=UPI003AB76488